MEHEDDKPMYCPQCQFCGYVDCCGIERFIEAHIRGKTDCLHEDMMIEELLFIWKCYQEDKKAFEDGKQEGIRMGEAAKEAEVRDMIETELKPSIKYYLNGLDSLPWEDQVDEDVDKIFFEKTKSLSALNKS